MARNTSAVPEQAYSKAVAIVTSDVTTYSNYDASGAVAPFIPDAIHVGVAGNVTIVDMGGNTTTLTGCLAGVRYPVRATKIMATGTTATNLTALYW